jgi:tRNA (guanine-N7-)-methyltransferase
MNAPASDDGSSDLRSFGRRRGRKISARQQALMMNLLPRVIVDPDQPPPEPLVGLFSTTVLMASDADRQTPTDVWLEIGFGGAEHLIWQSEHHPDVGIIGCEPFEEGVVKALTAIEEKRLANIRLYADDARTILRWLPPASISRAFVLFPDPWPKRKHARRRLINPTTVDLLARVIRPGGELRLATDIGDYVRTMLIAAAGHPSFDWQAAGPADWRVRPADWPQTRYEQKALREGRRGYFFRFRRRAD